MMFYNGFNLLIDMILAVLVWKAARYTADRVLVDDMNAIYDQAQDETLAAIDAGHIFKSECDGELLWSFTEEYVNA
jgi:hypothetical protein